MENVKILGMPYIIKHENSALSYGETGRCSPDALTITVEPNLPADKYNQTLFHEIIHAALSETGNKEEYENERLVSNLALALYQILHDCGALNMDCWLFKKPPCT